VSNKFSSLQGLRGLAALTVVVSHVLGAFYLTGKDIGTFLEPFGPVAHLFGILAAKAVWVFFVLSGYVLTHQLEKYQLSYFSFLRSRLARLYIPVWVSVLFSFLLITLLNLSGQSHEFWIGEHPDGLSFLSVFGEFFLVKEGYFLGPLWSLRWEVIFSILAFACWKLAFVTRYPLISIGLAIAVSTLGQALENGWMIYLPMFLIGVALYKKTSFDGWKEAIRPSLEVPLIGLSALTPIVSYLTSTWLAPSSRLPFIADNATSLLAISILFVLATRGSLIPKILETRPLERLGEFSFSLYLFHLPVIMCFIYFSNFDPFMGLLGFVLSFPISFIFFKIVEVPSQAIARKLRDRN
jgi:peptidoglycan/LPS O-acetylase OafA/YrhL